MYSTHQHVSSCAVKNEKEMLIFAETKHGENFPERAKIDPQCELKAQELLKGFIKVDLDVIEAAGRSAPPNARTELPNDAVLTYAVDDFIKNLSSYAIIHLGNILRLDLREHRETIAIKLQNRLLGRGDPANENMKKEDNTGKRSHSRSGSTQTGTSCEKNKVFLTVAEVEEVLTPAEFDTRQVLAACAAMHVCTAVARSVNGKGGDVWFPREVLARCVAGLPRGYPGCSKDDSRDKEDGKAMFVEKDECTTKVREPISLKEFMMLEESADPFCVDASTDGRDIPLRLLPRFVELIDEENAVQREEREKALLYGITMIRKIVQQPEERESDVYGQDEKGRYKTVEKAVPLEIFIPIMENSTNITRSKSLYEADILYELAWIGVNLAAYNPPDRNHRHRRFGGSTPTARARRIHRLLNTSVYNWPQLDEFRGALWNCLFHDDAVGSGPTQTQREKETRALYMLLVGNVFAKGEELAFFDEYAELDEESTLFVENAVEAVNEHMDRASSSSPSPSILSNHVFFFCQIFRCPEEWEEWKEEDKINTKGLDDFVLQLLPAFIKWFCALPLQSKYFSVFKKLIEVFQNLIQLTGERVRKHILAFVDHSSEMNGGIRGSRSSRFHAAPEANPGGPPFGGSCAGGEADKKRQRDDDVEQTADVDANSAEAVNMRDATRAAAQARAMAPIVRDLSSLTPDELHRRRMTMSERLGCFEGAATAETQLARPQQPPLALASTPHATLVPPMVEEEDPDDVRANDSPHDYIEQGTKHQLINLPKRLMDLLCIPEYDLQEKALSLFACLSESSDDDQISACFDRSGFFCRCKHLLRSPSKQIVLETLSILSNVTNRRTLLGIIQSGLYEGMVNEILPQCVAAFDPDPSSSDNILLKSALDYMHKTLEIAESAEQLERILNNGGLGLNFVGGIADIFFRIANYFELPHENLNERDDDDDDETTKEPEPYSKDAALTAAVRIFYKVLHGVPNSGKYVAPALEAHILAVLKAQLVKQGVNRCPKIFVDLFNARCNEGEQVSTNDDGIMDSEGDNHKHNDKHIPPSVPTPRVPPFLVHPHGVLSDFPLSALCLGTLVAETSDDVTSPQNQLLPMIMHLLVFARGLPLTLTPQDEDTELFTEQHPEITALRLMTKMAALDDDYEFELYVRRNKLLVKAAQRSDMTRLTLLLLKHFQGKLTARLEQSRSLMRAGRYPHYPIRHNHPTKSKLEQAIQAAATGIPAQSWLVNYFDAANRSAQIHVTTSASATKFEQLLNKDQTTDNFGFLFVQRKDPGIQVDNRMMQFGPHRSYLFEVDQYSFDTYEDSLLNDMEQDPEIKDRVKQGIQPQDWKTALHYAAERGDVELCRGLIECGANINCRRYPIGGTCDDENESEWARMMIRILKQHRRANPASIGIAETPLHLAIANNHVGVVRLLVEKGARLAVRTVTGGREEKYYQRNEAYLSFSFHKGNVAIDLAAKNPEMKEMLEGSGQKLTVDPNYGEGYDG